MAPKLAVLQARMVETLDHERERWLLWLPVGGAIGIGIYFALPFEPSLWLALPFPVVALAVGASSGLWGRWGPVVVIVAMAFGIVALGFAAAAWRTHQLDAPVLEKRIGPASVTGQVVRVEPKPKGTRITLGRLVILRLAPSATPNRVRIRVRRAPLEVLAGDWVTVRAILLPPPAPAAPGAFDFARYAYFQGLGAVGFAVGPVRVIDPAAGRGAGDGGTIAQHFRLWLAKLRQTVHRRITEGLKGTAGAVAAALMTGERGAIPERVLDSMRASGLAHLLAISGLHIGLVTGILFFAVRGMLALVEPVALRFAIKKWAAGAALLGAFAYLLLTGLTVPTQRAFLMTALVLLAVVLDRTAISMRLVAWAALIVLAVAPESLLGASFQMSFAAVTALVAIYEVVRVPVGRWRARLRWWHLALLYLGGVALTTVVAGTATAPFAAYHFNRVAVYGLAANLFAVPVTALWIMPWATVAYVLMPFGLEGVALAPMGWGIDVVIAIARSVSHWPGAVALVPAMSTVALVLVAIGGLWLCLWRRPWRLAGLAIIAFGLIAVPLARTPDVMVSGDGRLIAVRADDGGLLLSTLKRNRYDRESWLRRAGLVGAKAWPNSAGQAVGPDRKIACDDVGCLYRTRGNTVALVKRADAFLEDCWVADLVVAVVPMRRRHCPKAKLVIDRFDLWRNGAYAVWIDRDAIRAESVLGYQGLRPWSRIRTPRNKRRRR